MLLHDNARPHTAARTRALLEHFNWELFDHPPYNPDLALSDYYLFTYLKNWLRSQRFNSNEELMEGVKRWLNSKAADFFDTGIQKTSASIPAVTTLSSSLSMNKFFLIACFVNSSLEFTFRIALALQLIIKTAYRDWIPLAQVQSCTFRIR
jgi:hypothetical protein